MRAQMVMIEVETILAFRTDGSVIPPAPENPTPDQTLETMSGQVETKATQTIIRALLPNTTDEEVQGIVNETVESIVKLVQPTRLGLVRHSKFEFSDNI